MEADLQTHVAFFLTGRRPGDQLERVDAQGLRPALFAGYRELTDLRYDFPLVLVERGASASYVQSLSGLVDQALAAVARGTEGERIRKHVLRLEREVRSLVANGAGGSFSSLWDKAAGLLAADTDKTLESSLKRTRAAIKSDGEMVDCDEALPARLLRHAWSAAHAKKAAAFSENVRRLILKLNDILKAEFERSNAGRSAKNLKASIGTSYGDVFDFEKMSSLLAQALPQEAFPESRRLRIRELLAVLNAQQFFPVDDPTAGKSAPRKTYSFMFKSCTTALAAFRERMPRLVELAKAIAVAELEIDGQYNAAKHDVLFEDFGANGLDPQDFAPFPDYLVCVNAGNMQAAEHATLIEILSSGLPIKVLLQTDDILEESAIGEGNLTAGMRSKQIANMAIGLNEVYVLQSASSNLFRLKDRILDGLTYRGPALFSVYSGASGKASGLPPYLMAAAAMESRAFPAFTYDPSAGANWASRFRLDANSQLDLDWPVHAFAYEDQDHQRVSEDVAFTLVDFVACDKRYAKHFAVVPREKWNGSMIPIDESLTREKKGLPDKVPRLLMVDRNDRMQKVIVDERVIREARRCREMWHSLQELGGIHNSHAETLLAREKRAWEERMAKEAEANVAASPALPVAESAASAAPQVAAASADVEPERSPDEAYIETPRCSTCNECTQINNKMFAYDGNQQAYIKDINAGTYAQLVEAAESCQVAIIHPGKPANPNEPGIAELLKRAEAFN